MTNDDNDDDDDGDDDDGGGGGGKDNMQGEGNQQIEFVHIYQHSDPSYLNPA